MTITELTLYIKTGSKCKDGPKVNSIGTTSFLRAEKELTAGGVYLFLIEGAGFLFTFSEMQQCLQFKKNYLQLSLKKKTC